MFKRALSCLTVLALLVVSGVFARVQRKLFCLFLRVL